MCGAAARVASWPACPPGAVLYMPSVWPCFSGSGWPRSHNVTVGRKGLSYLGRPGCPGMVSCGRSQHCSLSSALSSPGSHGPGWEDTHAPFSCIFPLLLDGRAVGFPAFLSCALMQETFAYHLPMPDQGPFLTQLTRSSEWLINAVSTMSLSSRRSRIRSAFPHHHIPNC